MRGGGEPPTMDEPYITTTLTKTTLKWFQIDEAPSQGFGKGHSRSTTLKKQTTTTKTTFWHPEIMANMIWENSPFADSSPPPNVPYALLDLGWPSPMQCPTSQTCSFPFLSPKYYLSVLYCSLLLHDNSWISNLCKSFNGLILLTIPNKINAY